MALLEELALQMRVFQQILAEEKQAAARVERQRVMRAVRKRILRGKLRQHAGKTFGKAEIRLFQRQEQRARPAAHARHVHTEKIEAAKRFGRFIYAVDFLRGTKRQRERNARVPFQPRKQPRQRARCGRIDGKHRQMHGGAARKGDAGGEAGRVAGKIRKRRVVRERLYDVPAEPAVIEPVAYVIFRFGQPRGRERIDSRREAEIIRDAAHGARHFLAGCGHCVRGLSAAEQRERLTHVLAGNALNAGDGDVFLPHGGQKSVFKRSLGGIERHVRHQTDARRAVRQHAAGKRAGGLRHIEPRMPEPFGRAAQREQQAYARLTQRRVAPLRIGEAGDNQRIPRAGGNDFGDGLVLGAGIVVRQAQERTVSFFGRRLRERLIQIAVGAAAAVGQDDGDRARAAAAKRGSGLVDVIAQRVRRVHNQLHLLRAYISFMIEHVGNRGMGNADRLRDILDRCHCVHASRMKNRYLI